MNALRLRTKFLLASLGLVALLGFASVVFIQTTLTNRLELELQKRGISIARHLADEVVTPILTENAFDLQTIVSELKKSDEDLEYIFVMNPKGSVLAHTFGALFPTDLKQINSVKPGQTRSIKLLTTEKGEVFDIAVPLFKGELATVHVGMSAAPIRRSMAGIIGSIVWITACILAVGGIIATVFTVRITKPLLEFSEAAKAVGDGDLGRRVAVRTNDDLANLAATFNKMVDDLQTSTVSRARLEEIVKERTTDLSGAVVRLEREVVARKQAEEELRKHREQLMVLVDERTAELKRTNQKLLEEIAERERMEAELFKAQKLESIGVLAGGIAHDFNNLLTSILGNISMAMLDLDKGHPASRQLAGAEKASLRAQDLTRQLLTFSKGGAPIKRTTSIEDIIRESAGFALRGSRVRCEFFMAGDLWLVDADEGQISQVIHNLVINAEQAMPQGGIVTVQCENAALRAGNHLHLSPGRYVTVTVKDRGVGIPKEHLLRVFDPYFTTKQRGSGLGLATSYSIIRKHGGCITVESELGAGSSFRILLPASSSARAEKLNAEPRLSPASGKILLMDDEEGVRQTTGDALRRLGYSVVAAEDGARAVELYQDAMRSGAPFDLVLMDLTVPGGMGGEEAIKRLVQIDPAVRAVVSSGYSNDPILADYRSHGFLGAVTKPYRLEQLSEVVYRAISSSG